MPRPHRETKAIALGDRAVEALFVLAHHIQSTPSMRQQPLFREVDQAWLDSTRRGMVTIVLRSTVLLYAEAIGALPLGKPDYDASFALTPTILETCRPGPWKRLLRVSEVLSGQQRFLSELPIQGWGAKLFHASWLGPFSKHFLEDGEPLIPSDEVIQAVLHTLSWKDDEPIPLCDLPVEEVAGIYERLIGFELLRCRGRAVQWGNSKTFVDIDNLLTIAPADRKEHLASLGLKPDEQTRKNLEQAQSFDQILKVIGGRRRKQWLQPGTVVLQPNLARRRAGAHYTPAEVVREMVGEALRPLLQEAGEDPESIEALRICDPAMGTGGILVEACRQLADALVLAWKARGQEEKGAYERARLTVASQCLYGVDLDPFAVDLARTSLQLMAINPQGVVPDVSPNLRWGDALLGIGPWVETTGPAPDPHLVTVDWIPGARAACRANGLDNRGQTSRSRLPVERLRLLADQVIHTFLHSHESAPHRRAMQTFHHQLLEVRDVQPRSNRSSFGSKPTPVPSFHPFHWPLEFPEVLGGPSAGFDACIGNPPWVAFAGRAAQPLPASLRAYFMHVSEAFRGYRTLQALFVHRSASLLRPGGRLGLIVPTSMSDLSGYAAARVVHDGLCQVDPDLPDFGGHAFDSVFQPAMALLSTRREGVARANGSNIWPVHRDDLEDWARALMERLEGLPSMPAEAFAERGLQTMRDDVSQLRRLSGPELPHVIPIREGADVRAFALRPPRLYLDPSDFEGRLRSPEQYAQVGLLLRQTARYPMVALSDGIAFRNSLLAGFGFDGWTAAALTVYLNAWPIRWLHYMRHRDARQGMPQVKISHLRSLPAPVLTDPLRSALHEMGERLGLRNEGCGPEQQHEIGVLVGKVLGLSPDEMESIDRWRLGKGFE